MPVGRHGLSWKLSNAKEREEGLPSSKIQNQTATALSRAGACGYESRSQVSKRVLGGGRRALDRPSGFAASVIDASLAAASNGPVNERPGWRPNARAHVSATADASVARGTRGAPPDGLCDDPSAYTRTRLDGPACGLFDEGRGSRDFRNIETCLGISGHHCQKGCGCQS